jgi:hypothetical protein
MTIILRALYYHQFVIIRKFQIYCYYVLIGVYNLFYLKNVGTATAVALLDLCFFSLFTAQCSIQIIREKFNINFIAF